MERFHARRDLIVFCQELAELRKSARLRPALPIGSASMIRGNNQALFLRVRSDPSEPPPADKCMPEAIAIFHCQPAAEDGGYNCCGYQQDGRLKTVQGNGEKAYEQSKRKAAAETNAFF